MRKEADDVGIFLQLCLEFGNHRQRLGIEVVQVEDDERRLVVSVLTHTFIDVLVGLDEFDLYAEFACRFVDLGEEEQVVDKGIDSSGCVSRNGRRNGLIARVWPRTAIALGNVSVAIVVPEYSAIAVIHRGGIYTAKRLVLARTSALFVTAGAFFAKAPAVLVLALPLSVAVAWTMRVALTLSLWLAVLLIGLVRRRSAATAPPSASLPSGIAGRRIRSLIHVALLVMFVSPQIAGLPQL